MRSVFLLVFDSHQVNIVVPFSIPIPCIERPGDLHLVTDVVEEDIIDIIPCDLESLFDD